MAAAWNGYSFKYLGAIGSKLVVLSRITQATATMTKMKPILIDNNTSLGPKMKLMHSLVISIPYLSGYKTGF